MSNSQKEIVQIETTDILMTIEKYTTNILLRNRIINHNKDRKLKENQLNDLKKLDKSNNNSRNLNLKGTLLNFIQVHLKLGRKEICKILLKRRIVGKRLTKWLKAQMKIFSEQTSKLNKETINKYKSEITIKNCKKHIRTKEQIKIKMVFIKNKKEGNHEVHLKNLH